MIEGLKPYAECRDSGLQWLGMIPAHWRVVRAKTVLRSIDFRSTSGEEDLLTVSSERGVVLRTTANVTMFQAASYVGHKLCWPGDLVINSLWAWGRGLGVAQHHGIVSTAYGVYRPFNQSDIQPPYLNQLVRSQAFQWELQVRSKGVWISRLQLTDESFLNAPLPIPPLDEQAAIVRFLDHADRRIRRAIAAKQKLIRLLEEQKRAIIHRAVTRGLDPDVRLKPSGVEWLGDVPEHWVVMPLRRASIARCDGPFGSGLKSSHYVEDGVRVIRLQNIGHAEFRGSSAAYISEAHYASLGDHSVLPGDILIAGLGDDRHPAGRACVAPTGIGLAMVKADCFRFRVNESRLLPEFAALHLTATAVGASAALSTGATRQRTNLQSTASRAIAVPSIDEQREIVDCVADRVAPLLRAKSALDKEIVFLREYRIRLVADVVTGKLDVREAAANLSEMIAPGEGELDAAEEFEEDSMEDITAEDQAA